MHALSLGSPGRGSRALMGRGVPIWGVTNVGVGPWLGPRPRPERAATAPNLTTLPKFTSSPQSLVHSANATDAALSASLAFRAPRAPRIPTVSAFRTGHPTKPPFSKRTGRAPSDPSPTQRRTPLSSYHENKVSCQRFASSRGLTRPPHRRLMSRPSPRRARPRPKSSPPAWMTLPLTRQTIRVSWSHRGGVVLWLACALASLLRAGEL